LLRVCDIEAVAGVSHELGAKLVVDNTFASPYLCRPLDLGADISVHSATKFLGGHGDAIGGVAVTNDAEIHESLVNIKKLVGGMISVWEAHHILRGIKTLGLRMDRQCENARILAERLRANEKITAVYYPGPQKILEGSLGGALVTIRLKDDTRAAAFRFMNTLELVVRATSLGDVYTLVSHSASSSHRELPADKRSELGISEGLVRISVGIEDIGDIIADIENALSK
jgi:cystathionine gamma-synthase/methionine-gamma-lyase